MPVIFPTTLLLTSLGGLVFIVSRRMRIIKETLRLQKELESQQKKIERAKKQKQREKEKALLEMKRHTELKHKALRNLGAINELMKKADQEISDGQADAALKTLIQVISLDENHRKGNELLARIYLEKGRFKKAELIYKHLIDLHPFNADYHSLLGQSYFQRRQFKAATRCYENAIELDKNNSSRFIDIGHVYATRKDYNTALEFYLQAHRLDVRNVELMFLIVEICLHNSDPISAREYLHKILDYEPYNQQAKTLLGEVLRDLQETA